MGKNESRVHCVKNSDDPARQGADERKHIACAGHLLQNAVFSNSKSIEDVERGMRMRA